MVTALVFLLLALVVLSQTAKIVVHQIERWREAERPQLPAVPKPDLMAIAKLEHELWGDREHSNEQVDAHCWICHPGGTPETIRALTPKTYWAHRDDIVDGARVERKGGVITNTPATPADDELRRVVANWLSSAASTPDAPHHQHPHIIHAQPPDVPHHHS